MIPYNAFQKTQMTRERQNKIVYSPGYCELFHLAKVGDKILDYGAGKCEEAESMAEKIFTYEPFPKSEVVPDYTHAFSIPEGWDIVLCNYVLNVLPEASRKEVLKRIYSLLKKGGKAIFSVRSKLPPEIKSTWKPHNGGYFKILDQEKYGQFQAEIDIKEIFLACDWSIVDFKEGINSLIILQK